MSVDLHLHSTASDGRLTPAQLVDAVAAAGVSTMAVTDHDTVAAVPEVTARCVAAGIELVPGIEITAVERGHDVHVLGYFIESEATHGPSRFAAFLSEQRAVRAARLEEIVRRLAALGMPLDLAAVMDQIGVAGGSVGRPFVARAMVSAGYAASTNDAFASWLGDGCPAFVPRDGAPVAQVVATIHGAGGLASLAHPGRTRIDDRIPEFVSAGLDALEVYHSDHDASAVEAYRRLAVDLDLLMTGGSDFHGEPAHGVNPGTATLPPAEWQRLRDARWRHVRR